MRNRFYELPLQASGEVLLFGKQLRPLSPASKSVRIGERELASWFDHSSTDDGARSHCEIFAALEGHSASAAETHRLFLLVTSGGNGDSAGWRELAWITPEQGIRELFRHQRLESLYPTAGVRIEWRGISELGLRPGHPDDSYVEEPIGSWLEGQRLYEINPALWSGEPAFVLAISHDDQLLVHHLEFSEGVRLLQERGLLDHLWG